MSTQNTATELTEGESQQLPGFDEIQLRNKLLKDVKVALSATTEKTKDNLIKQRSSIMSNVENFKSLINNANQVLGSVSEVQSSMYKLTSDLSDSTSSLSHLQQKMNSLEDSFSSIDGLLRSINSIAEQTNLLALNATIEAARAGDNGRGFAVVANEVKELSNHTKRANESIQKELADIGSAITELASSVSHIKECNLQSTQSLEGCQQKVSTISEESNNFKNIISSSQEELERLAFDSDRAQNDTNEVESIGNTIESILKLLNTESHCDSFDPIKRLNPLIEPGSSPCFQKRFTSLAEVYELNDDEILISATDRKGLIEFANNSFYAAAQFEPGELAGKPHNIIRHPDMPRTAFADLWETVKQGHLWQGIVLNKGKLGRIYWVKAIVFPMFTNSEISGYISVRSKPNQEEINQAINLYRFIA